MEVLRIENLSKYYTSQASVIMGLSNLSLSFSTGEMVAITGESGSGKSTLAHVLGGIIPYESGEMYICGRPTSHYDASDWEKYRRDMVGFISQSYGILAGNTVRENVESALILSGADPLEASLQADKILAEVELYELANRRASKLSSGQKQRLSIARALAKPSKILIADEPTGNLDRENSEKIISLLKAASNDRLVILVTHEFDEAKDAATRRIVLADGAVVTDARLSAHKIEPLNDNINKPEAADTPKSARKNKKPHLFTYVSALTLRSRPIFSALLCLLLALTGIVTFVFLGTFSVALDDTSTRIYDPTAFQNGDKTRIVVMRTDGESFTYEEYNELLNIRHVEAVERYGYITDVNYYYREETDYHVTNVIVNGPNYHPLLNPDDFQVTKDVQFFSNDLFMRTLPVTNGKILTSGSAPQSIYEAVSSDPSVKIGDVVTVYIRDIKNWSKSAYIRLNLKIVGEAQGDVGLYFSDELAAAICETMRRSSLDHTGWVGATALPYDPALFTVTQYLSDDGTQSECNEENPLTNFTLGDKEFIYPDMDIAGNVELGRSYPLISVGSEPIFLNCRALFETAHPSIVLTTYETFREMTDFSAPDQISLHIKDYAYTDRVTSTLAKEGYLALSPYRTGATVTDRDLYNERTVTLIVCLSSLILLFVLQTILMRAMFSSLNEHFRLLSNIGLTAKVAYASLALLLATFTAVGEVVAAGAITSLNAFGIEKVANIFKYLDAGSIAMLFAAHVISVAFALIFIIRGASRSVFSKEKRYEDIDISEMEEV